MTSEQNKLEEMSDCGSLGLLRPILDESEVQNAQRKIKEREERLNNLLGPMEPSLLALQSILVWEKPKQSAAVLLLTNAMFWLAATTSYRTFFLVCFIATVFVFSEAWRVWIWPEIRVQKPKQTESEGWVPVHPHLMCAPEIGRYLAEIWVALSYYCSALWRLRLEQPGLFCILVSLSCLGTAVLGHYISGFTLVYVSVMCILLWPCVFYHNLLQKAYIRFEPLMMRLEYKMKIKRKRSRRSKRGTKKPTDLTQDCAETESESDLEKFAPDPNPEATAALARAITDSEDENSSPSALTPRLSREPSIGHSDVEFSDHELNESALFSGLGEMPSFENVLNDNESMRSFLPSHIPALDDMNLTYSSDSLATITPGSMPSLSSVDSRSSSSILHPLPGHDPYSNVVQEAGSIPLDPPSQSRQQGQMKFVSSHFQDSSESDTEGTLERLTQGLNPDAFPDPIAMDTDEGLNKNNHNASSLFQSEVASAYASQLFGSVVSTALTGLGKIQQNVSAMTGNPASSSTVAKDSPKISRQSSHESDLADFEFLDEEDLDDVA